MKFSLRCATFEDSRFFSVIFGRIKESYTSIDPEAVKELEFFKSSSIRLLFSSPIVILFIKDKYRKKRLSMSGFIPINQIDSNQSFYYPLSNSEREINLLGKDQESKPRKKGLLKSFLSLFKRIRKEEKPNRDLKAGIVALKIGECNSIQGNLDEAKKFFSISQNLLKQSPSLKSHAEDELKKLGQ